MASKLFTENDLHKRIATLESTVLSSLNRHNALELENQRLRAQIQDIQTKKQQKTELMNACIFTVRLNNDATIKTAFPNWERMNTLSAAYKESPHFDKETCKFTAPITGVFFMDLGMRQKDKKGSLEVMLVVENITGNVLHYLYIGRTTEPLMTCYKSVQVWLQKGQTISALATNMKGHKSGQMAWCSFSGHLIAMEEDPKLTNTASAPPLDD